MFNKLFVVLCTSLVLCSSFAATADESVKTWVTLSPAAKDISYTNFRGILVPNVVVQPALKFYGTKSEIRAAQESLNDIRRLRRYEGVTEAEKALEKFEAKHRNRDPYTQPYSREGAKQAIAERKTLNDKLDVAKRYAKRSLATELHSDSVTRENADIAAAKKKAEDERLAKAAAKKIEDERLAKIAADKVIEDARLAKIAADKVIEDARLATIAAAKKKAEDDAYREKERKRLAEELKKQQAYAYKVKMEGEPLEKRLEDPVFAKKYKEDRIKLGWMLERKQRKEEAARIKEVIRKQRLKDMISIVLNVAGNIGAKDPNKITTITKDGQVRTLYCNPGPCTPGSVKLHENISGLEMGVDINTLAKRIETNAAQRKRQDNTNENNAKTAEDIASLGNVSLDTLFEQSEADLDETNDISLTRALSIPKNQVEKNKEAYKDSVKNSHKNKEAETDYVKNADEIKQYCLYEGC